MPTGQISGTCQIYILDVDEIFPVEIYMSRLLGVAYCWGVPRGIVFGFGEVGEGMEGGRLSTRGLLAE